MLRATIDIAQPLDDIAPHYLPEHPDEEEHRQHNWVMMIIFGSQDRIDCQCCGAGQVVEEQQRTNAVGHWWWWYLYRILSRHGDSIGTLHEQKWVSLTAATSIQISFAGPNVRRSASGMVSQWVISGFHPSRLIRRTCFRCRLYCRTLGSGYLQERCPCPVHF